VIPIASIRLEVVSDVTWHGRPAHVLASKTRAGRPCHALRIRLKTNDPSDIQVERRCHAGNLPNPACGATYSLTADNVGKQFACRKCRTLLRVEADGLYLASPEPAETVAIASSPARRAPGNSFAAASLIAKAQNSVYDITFGVGAVLVIVFTFFPVLDQLRHSRYRADIKAQETAFHREDRDRTSPLPSDTKKARDKKLEELNDSADDHEASMMYSGWWYGWGMLFGFLLLAAASIAWMGSNHSRTHRVVAAIVICTELLLVFIVYVVRSQSALRL